MILKASALAHDSVHEVYRHSAIRLRGDVTKTSLHKLLIVGAGSYIGTNIEQYLISHSGYEVSTLDAVNLCPKPEHFRGFDAVLFVAGIAHRKETKENAHLYYEVNTDLAVRTAKAVKAANVPYFLLFSSMSVYGAETGHITKDTRTNPGSHYGRSKLAADEAVWKLRSENFRITVLRPPMVYGRGCRGNYQLLRKLALLTPVFPQTDNERSMIYIGNLCEFVKRVIDKQKEGIFFPQNAAYVNTSEMVRQIAASHGRKVRVTRVFNHMIHRLHTRTADKVFGSLTYEKTDLINMYGFEKSVKSAENEKAAVKPKGALPPFSVLMSVYCKEKPEHMQMSLNSILVSQTLKPDEVVLVCDGKLTEELDSVIHKYQREFPYIIRVFRKKQEGLGYALNYGLGFCTYDLVARADTDDICDRKRFETQVRYMDGHPQITVCSSYIDEFDTDWKKPHGIKKVPLKNARIRQWAKYRNPINHMASIYRKEPLLAIGSYRHVEGAEDYDLWVRAMSEGMELANIPKVLVHARVGNGMVKRRSNREYIKTWRTIDQYMLDHQMMNKIEYMCSMFGVRVFVYMPQKMKEILYGKVLRNRKATGKCR